jgi:hypothetical protein
MHYAVSIYDFHPSSPGIQQYNVESHLYPSLKENVQCKFSKAPPSVSSLPYSLYLTLTYLNYAKLDLILSIAVRFSIMSHPLIPAKSLPPTCSRSEMPYLLELMHAANRLRGSLFSKCKCVECLRSHFAFSNFRPLIHALPEQIDLSKFPKGSLARAVHHA